MTNNIIDKVNTVLIKIFGGVELASLKAFFLNVIKRDAEVVVFTTRRSHLLYCLFTKYVITAEEFKQNNFSDNKKYITDKAICFNHNNIKDKKVLVVDDILVHGRALVSVVQKIEESNPNKIEQYVFAKSKDITTKAESKYIHISEVESKKGELEDSEWKRLSNQIVAALILSSIPYASYVFSISKKMNNKEFEELAINFKKTLINDDYQDYFLDLSLNEYENNSALTKIIEDNVVAYIFSVDSNTNDMYSYVRLYYNKITETCIIIPFYFMSSYTKNELKELSSKIFCNNIFQTASAEMNYRALTAYYSFLILENEKISNLINGKVGWHDTKEIIEPSYYYGFFEDMKKRINKDSCFPQRNHIIDCKNQLYKYHTTDNKNQLIKPDIYFDEYIRIIDGIKINYDEKKHSNQTLFLHTYLENVNEAEENYIKQYSSIIKPQKQNGLSFELVILLVKLCKSINCSVYDILSKAISGADSGLITISPNKYIFDMKEYYSNFLITGEQVCRLYQNEILIFIINLKYILDITQQTYNLEEFIRNNTERISLDEKKIKKIIECVKEKKYLNPFIAKNIYEKIYDKEFKIFLESLL